MFSHHSSDTTGFPSKWSEQKDFTTSDCQTDQVIMTDKDVQSIDRSSVETQEEEEEPVEGVESFEGGAYDEDKLRKFLTRVTPSLISELDKVQRSKAFSQTISDEDPKSSKPVRIVNTLRSKHHLPLEDAKVSCLSWSCSGNVIAVAFQAPYHSYFCTHSSAVHLYNLSIREFDPSTPNRVIPTESCVTRIAMHPYEPSVIAIATHDGAVEVWNMCPSDAINQKIVRHTDSVTQLRWVKTESHMLIVSSGLDGVMHLFRYSSIVNDTSRFDSYLMGEERNAAQPGVTCFAFSPLKWTNFVAALEGGALLQCSTTSAMVKGGKHNFEGIKNIKDPIVGVMARHTAPISAIEFSPYIPDLFAIATIEEKFYIYSLNQRASVSVIWCEFEVMGLVWSGSNAHAIYAWGNSDHPALFDSQTARQVAPLEPPGHVHSTSANHGKIFIPAASLNNKNPKLLAVGLSIGETHIYELPLVSF